MTTLLHIDASPRAAAKERDAAKARGSHTRQLSAHFVARWRNARPGDRVLYRDVGREPPAMASAAFVEAAFTAPLRRTHAMNEVLAESDRLIDELLEADVIVAGVPMYNFAVPAQFKAYIDNIVRVGRTFGFDRARAGVPYFPLLSGLGKKLVIVSARGDFGYDEGGPLAHMNHVEPSIRTAFGYIGITDVHSVASEYDEFGDQRLTQSLQRAAQKLDALVDDLVARADGCTVEAALG